MTRLERAPSNIVWAADNSGLYFTAEDRGSQNIWFVSALGGAPRQLTNGAQILSITSVNSTGLLVGTRSTPDKPADFDPSKKYPLLLYIHGGPHSMYGAGFNFEFQNHAAEGYVVLYTNPRGSTGDGQAFGNAIDNTYPGPVYFPFCFARPNVLLVPGMKVKVGVMGSAGEAPEGEAEALRAKAGALGRALAARGCVTLTGGTTGLPHAAGAAAHAAGGLHVGVSPASDAREHIGRFGLPLEGTDVLVYTGFGLKGRNVVLVRSCDVVLILRGGTGTLNELTVAHDEGRVVGCLTGTGGVADEAERLLNVLPKRSGAVFIFDEDPERLLERCLEAFKKSTVC